MNVTAVVVSWNVKDHLPRCLDSLQGAEMVVVVDNASTDGTQDFVRTHYPQVHLIANATNRGFAAAVNQGIAIADTDAVLVLNPDAYLLPGALENLTGALVQHPQAAAVGPKVINPDGTTQSTRRRFPTLATAFLESTIIQDHFPNLTHLQRFYCQDSHEDQEQDVDWLVGSCLLLRRSALCHSERSEESPLQNARPASHTITPVGLFDPRFFLYFEELDWFLRARQAGWTARYIPTARAIHQGGASTIQVPKMAHLYFSASRHAFYAKHYGPIGGAAVHAFTLLSYLLRALEDTAKLALGHRSELRRTRISLYLSVLRGTLSASF